MKWFLWGTIHFQLVSTICNNPSPFLQVCLVFLSLRVVRSVTGYYISLFLSSFLYSLCLVHHLDALNLQSEHTSINWKTPPKTLLGTSHVLLRLFQREQIGSECFTSLPRFTVKRFSEEGKTEAWFGIRYMLLCIFIHIFFVLLALLFSFLFYFFYILTQTVDACSPVCMRRADSRGKNASHRVAVWGRIVFLWRLYSTYFCSSLFGLFNCVKPFLSNTPA